MHNNYYFIIQLAKALEKEVLGKKLGACFTQNKDELILGFYGETKEFYIIAKLRQDFSVLNFDWEFKRAKRNTLDLWVELLGKKVEGIQTFSNERCFALQLDEEYLLLFKLFGNRSNIIVFQRGKPLKIFKKRLEGDLQNPLHTYERPLVQTFQAYCEAEGRLANIYPTFGKPIKEYLISKGYVMHPTRSDYRNNWEIITETLEEITEGKYSIRKEQGIPRFSLFTSKDSKVYQDPIEAINQFSREYFRTRRFLQLKQNLLSTNTKKATRIKNYLLKSQKKLTELTSGNTFHQIGDVLMANLHQVPERASSVTLFNFYTNDEVSIKLKQELTPQKNAEWYYRKGKNQDREVEFVKKSIKAKQSELKSVEKLIEQIHSAANTDDLKHLSPKKSIPASQKDNLPFKQFQYQGFTIWVGKNAKNNDLLTTRFAQKDDVWLHARDTPGSHVVIKNPSKGLMPPSTVIEYAAQLAAYYSKRKNEALCPVAYSFKKYVRKLKGSPAGTVVMDREQVMMVEPLKP